MSTRARHDDRARRSAALKKYPYLEFRLRKNFCRTNTAHTIRLREISPIKKNEEDVSTMKDVVIVDYPSTGLKYVNVATHLSPDIPKV